MRYVCLLAWLAAGLMAAQQLDLAEQRGVVAFHGLPVPGATVVATRDDATQSTVTDADGGYALAGLAQGAWSMQVEMQDFVTQRRSVTVGVNGAVEKWELEMLPLAAIVGGPALVVQTVQPSSSEVTDGLLINGSVNNGATSPFGQSQAFGNHRNTPAGLYTGNAGFTLDNSALDARPFSLTGQDIGKPAYNAFTGLASFGGPIYVPRVRWQNNPNFTLNYQWTRNRSDMTQVGLMPTAAQREGELTGVLIPESRISPQAQELLKLYPLPNFEGSAGYNYQVPVVTNTHQDTWQSRINQSIDRENQIYGSFAGKSTRADNTNIFGFLDRTDTLGLNAVAGWWHAFTPRLGVNLSYQFSRLDLRIMPAFSDRTNISGEAGIVGNDQEPIDWGPPTLTFASGIASLSDVEASLTHNQTNSVSTNWLWVHGRHNVSYGGDFRRQQFNLLGQQDGRGSFGFTGAATGNDFGGFLLGVPDTSALAFGNADKYFRASVYDAFFTDDIRVSEGLTIDAGLRWDYGSPIAEKYGRLVNLDVDPDFRSAVPVVGNGLVGADRLGWEPRIGVSWRPVADSSMVLRAGYGVYDNTSVYLPIMSSMAQQAPFSKSFSVQNSSADPLTLADGFDAPTGFTNTYAVDSRLRVGYAQNWSASMQRDLPGSLVLTATYLGSKGTRQLQQLLPNTYPDGAANPCRQCHSDYIYLESGGNSTREAGQMQMRRRLHKGFAATLQYTYSKSIDDAMLGGTSNQSQTVIAQNWLDLSAERALSNFDQRHLLSLTAQYSTQWRGALWKQWTFLTEVTAGSGLPETPIYFAAVNGTGVTGSIRPDTTGAPLYDAPPGLYLNPAAFQAPGVGAWGTAGRNSIIGPDVFVGNAAVARAFLHFDVRLDATNVLNHVTFTSWNVITTSAQFGLPANADAMRSVQATVRFRF